MWLATARDARRVDRATPHRPRGPTERGDAWLRGKELCADE